MTDLDLQIKLAAQDLATPTLTRASTALSELNRSAGSAHGALSNLGQMAQSGFGLAAGIAGFQGLQAAAGGVGDSVIGLNATLEQNKVAFTTMLGSADAADKMLKQLADFAAATPFEFKDLTEGTKRMLAFGFSAEQVMPMLKSIGDAAAGLGLSGAEGINRIGLALGQMQAKTKVSAEEMLQLTEVGVPAWDILSKGIGHTTAETQKLAEKGLIPASIAIDVLTKGMEERFPDMMNKQSQTFNGLMSTLHDTVTMGLAEMGQSVFGASKDVLASLVQMLNSPAVKEAAQQVGTAIGSAVSGAANAIRSLVQTAGPLIQQFASDPMAALRAAFEKVQEIMSPFVPTAERVKSAVDAVKTAVQQFLGPIQTSVTAWKDEQAAAFDARATLEKIAGVVNGISEAMQGATSFVREHREAQIVLGAAIGAGVTAYGLMTAAQIATTVAMTAGRVATGLMTAAQLALNAAMTANPVGIVIVALGALAGALIVAYNTSDEFREKVDAAFAVAKQAIADMWAAAQPILKAIGDAFNEVSSIAKQALSGDVSGAIGRVGQDIKNAIPVIAGALGEWTGELFKWGQDAASKIPGIVGGIVDAAKDWVSGLGKSGMGDAGSDLGNAIMDGIKDAITTGVPGFFGGLKDLVGEAVKAFLGGFGRGSGGGAQVYQSGLRLQTDYGSRPLPTATIPSGAGAVIPANQGGREAFRQSFAPYANYAASILGIDPSIVTAMAISESGGGNIPGNSFFGMKGSPFATGSVNLPTWELVNGQRVNINDNFATFDNPQQSVDAWIDFLQKHTPGVFGAKSPEEFAQGLKAGGYMTDTASHYAQTLRGLGAVPGGPPEGGAGVYNVGMMAPGVEIDPEVLKGFDQALKGSQAQKDPTIGFRKQLDKLTRSTNDQLSKIGENVGDQWNKALEDAGSQRKQIEDQANRQIAQIRDQRRIELDARSRRDDLQRKQEGDRMQFETQQQAREVAYRYSQEDRNLVRSRSREDTERSYQFGIGTQQIAHARGLEDTDIQQSRVIEDQRSVQAQQLQMSRLERDMNKDLAKAKTDEERKQITERYQDRREELAQSIADAKEELVLRRQYEDEDRKRRREQDDVERKYQLDQETAQIGHRRELEDQDTQYRRQQDTENDAFRKEQEQKAQEFRRGQERETRALEDTLAQEAMDREIARIEQEKKDRLAAVDAQLQEKQRKILADAEEERQALLKSFQERAGDLKAEVAEKIPEVTAEAQEKLSAFLAEIDAKVAEITGNIAAAAATSMQNFPISAAQAAADLAAPLQDIAGQFDVTDQAVEVFADRFGLSWEEARPLLAEIEAGYTGTFGNVVPGAIQVTDAAVEAFADQWGITWDEARAILEAGKTHANQVFGTDIPAATTLANTALGNTGKAHKDLLDPMKDVKGALVTLADDGFGTANTAQAKLSRDISTQIAAALLLLREGLWGLGPYDGKGLIKAFGELKQAILDLPDKTITITTVYRSVGSPSGGSVSNPAPPPAGGGPGSPSPGPPSAPPGGYPAPEPGPPEPPNSDPDAPSNSDPGSDPGSFGMSPGNPSPHPGQSGPGGKWNNPSTGQPYPFAMGGIVMSPTLGLLGDAGPEAVIPLRGWNGGGGNKGIDYDQLAAALAKQPIIIQLNGQTLARVTRDEIKKIADRNVTSGIV